MTGDLLKRLRRVKYVRERWVEPVGAMDEIVDADMADWPGVNAVPLNPDGLEAAAHIEALTAKLERAREALEWYAEQAGNCCKIGTIPEGVEARAILDRDRGTRARQALKEIDSE